MLWPILLLLAAAIADTRHIKSAQRAYDAGKQAQADKQFTQAAESFRQAIDIEPTFLDAYESLIATDCEADQPLNEAAAITQFLEIKPDAANYRLRLGQILLTEKQWQKALAQFSLVLARDPDNADGLLGFATAATAAGMKERAAAALERGRKRFPSDARFQTSAGALPQP